MLSERSEGEPIGERPIGRQSEATKKLEKNKAIFSQILSLQLLKVDILKKIFSFTKQYVFQKGTYHVYKHGKTKMSLSALSDRLRKFLPPNFLLFITMEKTLDGYPHFHYLVGYPKFRDASGKLTDPQETWSALKHKNEPSFLPILKGYKLWYDSFTRKKDIDSYILYMCKYMNSPILYTDYIMVQK